MRQCRGAAEYRANLAKRPRNFAVTSVPPEREHVFTSRAEFLAYHDRVRV